MVYCSLIHHQPLYRKVLPKFEPTVHARLCYFINSKTGSVSLDEPPNEEDLGANIYISIYSLAAKNLLTRLKLEPFEVEAIFKTFENV
jgi:hypothetical protein